MTMIDVDTSPLQAAREWRGIGLVAAAMHSGLPMTQAEALEEGDPSAFGSIDEMIAAAIVYGASIGVGRDEAVALLDRTVSGTGAQVRLPDAPVEAESSSFSGAVRSRSARIADRTAAQRSSEAIVVEPIQPEGGDDAQVPDVAASSVLDAPVPPAELAIELPDVPGGPTPEQAMAASSEIYMGDAFAPGAPWERDGNTGELEAWVDEIEPQRAGETGGGAAVRRRSGGGFGRGVHALTERVVGTDKADAAAEWMRGAGDKVHEWTRIGREKLRRSEHATLIVAIGGGAVLIALLVAIGGALGGGDDDAAGPGPAKREPAASTTSEAGTTGDVTGAAAETEAEAATKAVAAAPLIPPARLTVDVYNAGSQKGVAKEVAGKLTAAGYGIGEVGNAKEDYATARIIHPKDMAREARLIAKRTGITTLQVAPGSTRKITVVTGI